MELNELLTKEILQRHLGDKFEKIDVVFITPQCCVIQVYDVDPHEGKPINGTEQATIWTKEDGDYALRCDAPIRNACIGIMEELRSLKNKG